MPNHGSFGRAARGGAPHPLIARVDTGITSQLEADDKLNSFILTSQIQEDGIWSLKPNDQIVALQWWLASTYWQLASAFVHGTLENNATGSPSQRTQNSCESWCQLAERAMLRAVQLQGQVDAGVRLTLDSFASKLPMNVDAETCNGVWKAAEALFLIIQSDFSRISGLLTTERFHKILGKLERVIQPTQSTFSYYERRWNEAIQTEPRITIAQEAARDTEVLFATGQQIWAPYLIGEDYAAALRIRLQPKERALGFDPWILTDPKERQKRQQNASDQETLASFWRGIQDPAAVHALYQQLLKATTKRQIRLRTGNGYSIVPWPSQYLVRYPITLGTRQFAGGDLVSFFSRNGRDVEVRKTGEATTPREMLGQ